MFWPMISYDGKMHIGSWYEGTYNDCVIGVHGSGIMDRQRFVNYFIKEVIRNMTRTKVVHRSIIVLGHH